MTTLLQQKEAFHKAILLTKLSPYDPETNQRIELLTGVFQSRGYDAATAYQQALATLEQTVNQQVAVLSYADVFRVVGIIFFCSLPLLLFLGKGRSAKQSSIAH
jgi:DHA2 family multidrug resistance protein